MNEEQRKAQWNMVRSRGGLPVMPKDVKDCGITCEDPNVCYIDGCVHFKKSKKEKQ